MASLHFSRINFFSKARGFSHRMSNSKILFNYGKPLTQLGEYDRATSTLQKVNGLLPKNESIYTEILKVEEFRIKYRDFCKLFAQKALKIIDANEDDEFEKTVIEMCDAFVKDESIIKYEIPNGLTAAEQECIRRVGASKGLSITKQNRYELYETLFLTKPDYH